MPVRAQKQLWKKLVCGKLNCTCDCSYCANVRKYRIADGKPLDLPCGGICQKKKRGGTR